MVQHQIRHEPKFLRNTFDILPRAKNSIHGAIIGNREAVI
jgi:hypothetical protein